jgi:hypothetical protein
MNTWLRPARTVAWEVCSAVLNGRQPRRGGVLDRFELKCSGFQKWKLGLATPYEAGTGVYLASSMTCIALTSA